MVDLMSFGTHLNIKTWDLKPLKTLSFLFFTSCLFLSSISFKCIWARIKTLVVVWYKGLYYPVIWGFVTRQYTDPYEPYIVECYWWVLITHFSSLTFLVLHMFWRLRYIPVVERCQLLNFWYSQMQNLGTKSCNLKLKILKGLNLAVFVHVFVFLISGQSKHHINKNTSKNTDNTQKTLKLRFFSSTPNWNTPQP